MVCRPGVLFRNCFRPQPAPFSSDPQRQIPRPTPRDLDSAITLRCTLLENGVELEKVKKQSENAQEKPRCLVACPQETLEIRK